MAFSVFWGLAGAANLEREQRLADEIVDSILDGDPVDIEADGQAFLGIYTETDADQPKGGILILHGRGFHPDWLDVVQPLRVGLTGYGWNTLSIQMPVLDKVAKYNQYVPVFPEAIPRIESAIAYLKEAGNKKIVLIAHSCGAHMAHHWIHAKGRVALGSFDAYVGIGMGATDYKQPMQEPFPLDRMKMPVLDVMAGDDYPAVIRMQPLRRSMMDAAGNPQSRQLTIPGANHYFSDMGDPLVEGVAAWLETL